MKESTKIALEMLFSGWTVEYSETFDDIQWRSPGGLSGSDFHSSSLDEPPQAAIDHAKETWWYDAMKNEQKKPSGEAG